MENQDLLLQIKTAYDEKIRPLVNINEIDINKIALLIKQLTYQITGNEDVLVKKDYDKQTKKVLENFNSVFQRMKTSNDVYELFKEMEETQDFIDLSDNDKIKFAKSMQNPILKLEILNTILVGVFCTICLESAGFDVEF